MRAALDKPCGWRAKGIALELCWGSVAVVNPRATSECVTSMASIRTTNWVLDGQAIFQISLKHGYLAS